MSTDAFSKSAEWHSLAPYSRSRKSVEVEPYEVTTVMTTDYSWTTDTTVKWSWPILGSYYLMDDIVTPRYKEIVANGGIVNNPCRQYSIKLEASPITRSGAYSHYYGTPQRSDWYVRTWTNWIPILDNPSGYGNAEPILTRSEKDNAIRYAIVEAYGKLDQVEWMLPVDVFELHKTLKMLGNAIQHFRGLIRFLRGKGTKKPKRRSDRRRSYVSCKAYQSVSSKLGRALSKTGDAASNKTLEFLYGWIPLAMSIEDAFKALERLEPETIRQTVSASCPLEEEAVVSNTSLSYPLGSGNGTLTSTYSSTRTEKYRARCGICASQRVTWRNVFTLTWWDAPSVLWELTHLSFVVDWFLKIGDWLKALKVRMQATIEYSWLTVTEETTITKRYSLSGCSCRRQNSSTDYETYYEPATQECTLMEYTKDKRRTPNPPFPSLPAWSPDLLAIRDLNHVAAGLALSYQALARLVRTR